LYTIRYRSHFTLTQDGYYWIIIDQELILIVFNPVQLIGYGTDPQDGDYWLIKNSWGDMWGDGWESNQGGYIKLKR
jgi:cathepsin L